MDAEDTFTHKVTIHTVTAGEKERGKDGNEIERKRKHNLTLRLLCNLASSFRHVNPSSQEQWSAWSPMPGDERIKFETLGFEIAGT